MDRAPDSKPGGRWFDPSHPQWCSSEKPSHYNFVARLFLWVVAQLAEHLAVNEAVAGSSPVDPPISILDRIGGKSTPQSKIRDQHEAVAERRMHFIVDEDDDGSSPFGPAMSLIGERPRFKLK